MRAIYTLLCCLLVVSAFGQCDYDLNGDGYLDVGDNDLLQHLAQHGLLDMPSDHNGNGITDIRDILAYMRHSGQSCPVVEVPLSSGRIQGLVLSEHIIHTDGISDIASIPAGAVTYRLYAQVTDENDCIHAVFGDASNPLEMTSTGGFISSEFTSNALIANTSPALLELFPTISWSTWLTTGWAPQDDIPANQSMSIEYPDDNLSSGIVAGEDVLVNSDAGSGWFDFVAAFAPAEVVIPNLRLIAQFTVEAGSEVSGTVNLHIVTKDGPYNIVSYEEALSLTYGSTDLTELGCTDPAAENYNAAAALDDNSCTYLGDFDGDGMVGSSDILLLIGNLGCTTCEDLDVDGDGVIAIGDILTTLGLFG